MRDLSFWKKACAAFVVCAATAIAASAQTFTTLVNFDGTNGATPVYVFLVQGVDGNFYGTTSAGGNLNCGLANGCGTVFKITPEGVLTTLYSFCAQADCADGFSPYAGLVLATDGNFYGTTVYGGTGANCFQNCGTVFRITPRGALLTLHNFNYSDGSAPWAQLIQAIDGNLYGTTSGGSFHCSGGCGTIFRMTLNGTLTTLHSFNYEDGAYPIGGLVQASDGNFFGSTTAGGIWGEGTEYTITPEGVLTAFNNGDNFNSMSRFVEDENGLLYGVAAGMNDQPGGSIFEMNLYGKITTLKQFIDDDYGTPLSGLALATDGNLYGSARNGHSNQCCGALFDINPDGAFTLLYTFGSDGNSPVGGLLQATNGMFYGTASAGGNVSCSNSVGCGTVYRLDAGLGPFVSLVLPAGRIQQTNGILGQGFTGTSAVLFNGIPASFTVVSDTFLKATVPAGATTGYVTVTTPSGTLTSNVPFQVIP
jgi:uncharacterized repeat protein (TIGR03803 family)